MVSRYQCSLLEHMLGSENPNKWFRNYFMATPDHHDLPDLIELQKEGMIRRYTTPTFCNPDGILFKVTEKGKTFLKMKIKDKLNTHVKHSTFL